MRLLILLLIFSSCNGQNTTSRKTDKKIKQEISMRTFDIETFNQHNQNNEYSFITHDSIEVKQYSNEKEYWETVKPQDSIYEQFYEYFSNGKLKRSVKRYPKSFTIGYLKEYDLEGNLVKQENLDKPFTYTWEKIKEYLKEHKVENIQKQVIDISRWNDHKETTWTLEFNGEYNRTKGRYVITLDGKTGEELEVKLFKGKGALGETGTTAIYDTIYKKAN